MEFPIKFDTVKLGWSIEYISSGCSLLAKVLIFERLKYNYWTDGQNSDYILQGELLLSGNHTVTEYDMSGELYSQKSGFFRK